MSDIADSAADYQQRLNDEALARVRERGEPGPGLTHCRIGGAPIGDYRRLKLHAQLCLECQTQMSAWGRVREPCG